MTSTVVKVEGLKEVEAALAELPKATSKRVLRKVGAERLERMAQVARSLAPDDPSTPDPDLNTSIIVSSRQKSGRQIFRSKEGEMVHIYMGPNRDGYPQAMPQEFGAPHHPPHPYMRPAWDQGKDALLDGIGDDLWREIEKAAKRLARKAARLAAKSKG